MIPARIKKLRSWTDTVRNRIRSRVGISHGKDKISLVRIQKLQQVEGLLKAWGLEEAVEAWLQRHQESQES